MRFRFRYEALLSYRKYLKEQAEIELAKANEQLRIARQDLEEMLRKYETTNKRLEQKLEKRIYGNRLQDYTNYLLALKSEMEQKASEISEWEKRVDKKRKILLQKNKEWKILDTLKERDYKKWLQEANKKEQKEINEMAIVRYGRDFL